MHRVLVSALILASLATAAGISEVQSVYLLPMAGGLDQYLANRLNGVFRVVTDPKLADAVITDQLGEVFEQKLADLYPPPPAAKTEEKDDDKDTTPRVSSFQRGRGTIFLVDLQSRAVIWSGYQKRTVTTPDVLDHTASVFAKQIKKQQQQETQPKQP